MTDEDLFGKAMRDVAPLPRTEKRVTRHKHSSQKRIVPPATPMSPPVRGERRSDPRSGPKSGDAPWVLKADGVSPERLRQLAAGRPPVNYEMDLHGLTQEKMYQALARAFEEALAREWRVLCLVHGRGMHSRQGRSVLREAAYRWLAEGPFAGRVLAVMPRPGSGGGAALVLLRRQR